MVPRVVAFVSKNGLPKNLSKALSDRGVEIFTAKSWEGKGHAEDAAESLVNDPISGQMAQEALGGKLQRVLSAVMNNPSCSEACATAFNKFFNYGRSGNSRQEISEGDYGIEPTGQVVNQARGADLKGLGDEDSINPYGGLARVYAGYGEDPDEDL